jgi:metallophosphoesterase superfamily enzyme
LTDEASAVLVLPMFTIWIKGTEVLVTKFASPL